MDFGTLRLAASDLMSRFNLATRSGTTFKGERDLQTALGYKPILEPQDYYDRYKRGGVAARIVEAKPKATWRAGIELVEDEDPTVTTEFEEQWEELEERLQIWSTLCKADILAGLGRFAIVLIGAPGNLNEPMPDRLTPDNLLYLQSYSEVDVKIHTFEIDVSNPRFGLPELYQVRVMRTTTGFESKTTSTKLVHWSRVLHVADETLDDRVYGNPRLERVWNYLDDLDKVSGAGAEAFWKRADRGLIFKIDPTMKADDPTIAATKDAADEFWHGLRRTMAVRGMDVEALGSDVANIVGPVEAIGTLLAGASGIPKRILFGSERGELASSQDERNWSQRIDDRRAQLAEPQMVRPLVKLFTDKGILPEPVDGYDVRWPKIDSLSELEQANIATQWCGFNSAAGAVVVTAAEIRDRVLGLDKLSPEDEAKATPEPPPPPPAPIVVSPGQGVVTQPKEDKAPVAAMNFHIRNVMPELPAVNVRLADVNVNVEPAAVNVTVEPPDVNVRVDAPSVSVDPHITIEEHPEPRQATAPIKPRTFKVTRDKDGRIEQLKEE